MITTAAAPWPTWPPTTSRGEVFGRRDKTTGIAASTNLVAQVISREPYPQPIGCPRIVDNGSSHRGQAAIDRVASNTPTRSRWTPPCTRSG